MSSGTWHHDKNFMSIKMKKQICKNNYSDVSVQLRRNDAYPHADDGHSEVGPSQVNSQSTLCLQDVIDVLGDAVFHWRETEGLLERLVKVNGTQKLENARHCVAITINFRAE